MVSLSGIDLLGIDRVLRRGTGEMVAEREGALLVRDSVSEAYLLGCPDPDAGHELLDLHVGPDCRLLMVSDHALGMETFTGSGFSEKLECYQTAYYGEKPQDDGLISVRTAGADDLPVLEETYDLISSDELEKVVMRGSVLLGYSGDRLVGFIGEHLEGSMGLLYIFPEFRRKGFGTALQRRLITRTIEEGYIPFGQVEKSNRGSLLLQKKLGMTVSENLIVWMWR